MALPQSDREQTLQLTELAAQRAEKRRCGPWRCCRENDAGYPCVGPWLIGCVFLALRSFLDLLYRSYIYLIVVLYASAGLGSDRYHVSWLRQSLMNIPLAMDRGALVDGASY